MWQQIGPIPLNTTVRSPPTGERAQGSGDSRSADRGGNESHSSDHTAPTAVALLYGLIQVEYWIRLEQDPLIDPFYTASDFLRRAIAGVAEGLWLSSWFLLIVGLLALSLAIEKRKAELPTSQDLGTVARKVLRLYSLPLLERLQSLVCTCAFMSCSLWASGPALNAASTTWMLLTVAFVLAGILRDQPLSDPDESMRQREQGP
jgi:decaprenyl-phosphate phosphoribosyltransferase